MSLIEAHIVIYLLFSIRQTSSAIRCYLEKESIRLTREEIEEILIDSPAYFERSTLATWQISNDVVSRCSQYLINGLTK